jgi:hypothetical protein
LLKLDMFEEQRRKVVKLLAEAQAQLPFAMAEERRLRRNCRRLLPATL